MPVFATLQQAGFGGFVFPIAAVDIQGGIRDHHHEYPHADGAAVEKLGRKLYLIKMEGLFHTSFPKYPNLFPQTINGLRKLYEAQTTTDLVIPTIGTIKAYCRNWSEQMTSKHSSGVNASFEFSEDQQQAELVSSLVSVNAPSMRKALANFQAAMLNDFSGDHSTESLFDAINDLGNSVLSFADQFELYGNLLGSKLLGMAALIDQFDRIELTNDCKHFFIRDALHDLWDTVNTAIDNSKLKQISPEVYFVPTLTSIQQVSQSLYGDTTHSIELLQLNPIEDPYSIRAGTQIKYYPVPT